MIGTILVVDDESSVRYALRSVLEEEDLRVIEAKDGVEALARLEERDDIDLVVTDLRMPRMDGMELLNRVGARPGSPEVIVITAHGSTRDAVEAMRRGALDYFHKPFDSDEIAGVVLRSLKSAKLRDENARLRAALSLGRTMVFESASMHRLAQLIERVAARDVTVLITGETGTGKERVAEAIVRASTRADRPFVRFNCAGLPPTLADAELFGHTRGAFTGAVRERRGLFREAHGGTLLLDEIGELDPSTQAKLLRAVQERRVRPVGADGEISVDVRLLAATHRDLADDSSFRRDLYYRLSVVKLHLPPLRERPEDIPALANHFARRYAESFGVADPRLDPALIQRLAAQPWPGNVRELENAIERLVALSPGPTIDASLLDEAPPRADHGADEGAHVGSLKDQVDAFERRIITLALLNACGNRSEAARTLQTSRITLLSKMKKYGVE